MTVNTTPLGTTALTTSLEMTTTTTLLGNPALTTSLEMTATTTPSGMVALTTSLEMTAATIPSGIIAPTAHSETSVNTLNSHQIKMPQQNTTIIDITTSGMDVNTSYSRVQQQHPRPPKYRTITSPKVLIVGIHRTNILMQKEVFHMKQEY